MNVVLYASRTCHHRAILEEWLEEAGLHFDLLFAERASEVGARYGIRSSLTLIVDDAVRFAGMPSRREFLRWAREAGRSPSGSGRG